MSGSPSPQKPISEADLGYPHIEKLIETEDFARLNSSFAESYKKLELIFEDSGSGLKKQKAAQKAMQAYEITTQLMNELLGIKQELLKMQGSGAKK